MPHCNCSSGNGEKDKEQGCCRENEIHEEQHTFHDEECCCHEKKHTCHDEDCSCHEEKHTCHDEDCSCHEEKHSCRDEECSCHEEKHTCHDEGCSCHEEKRSCRDEECSCHEEKHICHDEECCCHEEKHTCHDEKCSCHSDKHEHKHRHDHEHKHESRCGCGCGCHGHEKDEKEEKAERICLIVGAIMFAAAIVLQALSVPIVPQILYVAAWLSMGYGTFCELVEAFRDKDFFGETTLMTVSSLGAMIIGDMAEGCMVMLLFAVGEILEHKAQSKSRKNIEQLLAMKPKQAVRLSANGEHESVAPEELKVGDIVLVNAGDTVPCDGEIVEGTANADTSSITGESVPAVLEKGKSVRCGYVSLDGSLRIKVSAAYADNTFSKILDIISNNSEKKSKSENFVKKFAKVYTPIVMAAALVVMVVGSIATRDIATWVYRGLVFLATSCPCAFVISVPLTFFFGIGEMTRIGLLVKGSEYIEKLSSAKAVAFDKTGTVTKGELNVVNVTCTENVSETELIRLCAGLERNSNHPIASEIVSYALANGIEPAKVSEIREISGMGISGVADGRKVSCGNHKILHGTFIPKLSEETTKVYVTADGDFLGVIELSDEIKPEAKSVISSLNDLGVARTVMLTGDSSKSAQKVAAECGIKEVHSGLEPVQKGEILEDVISSVKGGTTVFVGDGINDAPVLALADVGIAVGGTGAEISVETADAVILGSSLEAVSKGIKAAKIIMSRVKFNVIFAISIKLAILILTLLGYANMGLAVFGDVGVTIIVILNALRRIGK